MPDLPAPIDAYIRAYNTMGVDGLLTCLADEVRFETYTGDTLTAEAPGIDAFERMARAGVMAFESRRQTVTNAITVADSTAVEIDDSAVLAQDLPNGWKAGQRLAFAGASWFRLRDGLIDRIVDQSRGEPGPEAADCRQARTPARTPVRTPIRWNSAGPSSRG